MEKSTITAKAAAAMASAASVSSKVKPARGLLRAAEAAGFNAGSPSVRGGNDHTDTIKCPGKGGFLDRRRRGHGRSLHFQRPVIAPDNSLLDDFRCMLARGNGADQRARD